MIWHYAEYCGVVPFTTRTTAHRVIGEDETYGNIVHVSDQRKQDGRELHEQLLRAQEERFAKQSPHWNVENVLE